MTIATQSWDALWYLVWLPFGLRIYLLFLNKKIMVKYHMSLFTTPVWYLKIVLSWNNRNNNYFFFYLTRTVSRISSLTSRAIVAQNLSCFRDVLFYLCSTRLMNNKITCWKKEVKHYYYYFYYCCCYYYHLFILSQGIS